MTISSTDDPRAGPFNGNGTQTEYPFEFKTFSKSDLIVALTDADGLEITLVLDSDFSVALNADQDEDPGGTVTYPVSGDPLPLGETLTIASDLEFTQPTDITNGGGFYPQVIENALDRIVMLVKQANSKIARSLQLSFTTPGDVDVILPPPEADQLIGWDGDGTGLRNVSPTTLATIVAFATWESLTFDGDGVTTQFTLSSDPANINNMDVQINGVGQRPALDFTLSGTTITFLTAPVSGTDNILVRWGQSLPQGSAEDSDINVLQPLSGAVLRTQHDKNLDSISVRDFGAVGDGVTDDHAAIQAALNTGRSVYMPQGVYLCSSFLLMATVGQRLFGENAHSTYITSPAASTHDQLRIASSHCEVCNVHFRPGSSGNLCIRIYAALAHVHDNRFLAAVNNAGTAIYLDDVNPATMGVVAGAYTHTIENNRIGATGFAFQYAIFSLCTTNGQQATKFQNNQILGDDGIYVYKGGGNYYVGNLMQTSTGTAGTPAGNGIDLQAGVVGETITGNYLEKYLHAIIARRVTQDYSVANVYGNQYDNCTNRYYSTGSTFYKFFDDFSLNLFINGWRYEYNSQDDLSHINREGSEIWHENRVARSFEPYMLAHNEQESLSYSANGTTRTPTASWCQITGGGVNRTGCFLGNGTRIGQHLYLRAFTWQVQILNNPGGTQNIVFAANAASATFGNSATNVISMHLIWDPGYSTGRWFEISRVVA